MRYHAFPRLPTSTPVQIRSLPMGCHGVPALPMCFPWELNAMETAPPFTSHGDHGVPALPTCLPWDSKPWELHLQALPMGCRGSSALPMNVPWAPQLCLLCCAAPTCADAAGLYSCAQARAVACAGLRRVFSVVVFPLRRLECTVESGRSSSAVLMLACWQHACMPTRAGVNAYERLLQQ